MENSNNFKPKLLQITTEKWKLYANNSEEKNKYSFELYFYCNLCFLQITILLIAYHNIRLNIINFILNKYLLIPYGLYNIR